MQTNYAYEDLHGKEFTSAVLANYSFNHSYITNGQLYNVQVDSADLTLSTWKHTLFSNSVLNSCYGEKQTYTNCLFTQVEINDHRFYNSHIENTAFVAGAFNNTVFSDVTIDQSSFVFSFFDNCTINHLQGVDDNSTIAHCTFTNCQIGVTTGVHFVSCDFIDCDIDPSIHRSLCDVTVTKANEQPTYMETCPKCGEPTLNYSPCPYSSEIYGDDEDYCNCCNKCAILCAMEA